MKTAVLTALIVLCALVSAFASSEQGCRSIVDSVSYEGAPADVSAPTARILGAVDGSVLALDAWSDAVSKHSQFIETTDGIRWKSVVRPYGLDSTDDLIAITQSQGSPMFFREGRGDDTIERSNDNGQTWVGLRFDIDDMPSQRWIRIADATPGAQLVAHFAATIPGSPATIYATFQIWVPEAENPKEFSHWKDIDGMYVSRDAGDTWRLLTRDLVAGSPFGVGGTSPLFMLGLEKAGLMASRDGGRNWAAVGQQQWLNNTIEITGRKSKLAALRVQGHEQEQRLRGGVPLRIHEILLSPSDTGSIYLRTNAGLIVSQDFGQTWNVCPVGGKTLDIVNAAVFIPSNPHEILISTNSSATASSQILLSRDGGQTYAIVYTSRRKSSSKLKK